MLLYDILFYDLVICNSAKTVVENLWQKFKSEIQENPIHLDLVGLGHFDNRVSNKREKL